MTVKILLKQIREKRGLSQNKLARLMEMSPQNIQRIEYGEAKSIPLETLDKLCEVLDCEPGDLLIRVNNSDSNQENTLIEQMLRRLSLTPMEKDNLKQKKSTQMNKPDFLLQINSMSNSA